MSDNEYDITIDDIDDMIISGYLKEMKNKDNQQGGIIKNLKNIQTELNNFGVTTVSATHWQRSSLTLATGYASRRPHPNLSSAPQMCFEEQP